MKAKRLLRSDVKTSFYLRKSLLRAAKAAAVAADISLRAWLVRAVVQALAHEKEDNG